MSSTLSKELELDSFWRWFVLNSSALKTIRSANDAAHAELERMLAHVNSELGVEIGGDDKSDDISLIITAHADASLFPIVDALVQRAPRIDAWQIHALKPPLLEDLKLEYDGGVLQLSDIWFRMSGGGRSSGGLQIQIAGKDFNSDAKKNAALLALESFLGEGAFTVSIEIENLVELPSDPNANGFLPISRLPDTLAVH